jgi:hypothetical protein
MRDPISDDVVHLSQGKHDEMVQGFGLELSYEGFDECVHVGRTSRQSERFRAQRPPEVPEVETELRVPVHQKPSRLDTFVLHPHGGVASLLHHPLLIGMERGRTAAHAPTSQVDEHKTKGIEPSTPSVYSLRKEVHRDQGFHVGGDELSPRHRRPTAGFLLRGGIDALAGQDALDGIMADGIAEFLEFADDPAVTPEQVLPTDAHNQVSDFLSHARSAGLLRLPATSGVINPAPIGCRFDDFQDGAHVMAELGADSEQLGLFVRAWHNMVAGQPPAQDGDLRLEEPDLSVVARSGKLKEHPEDGFEGVAHG